MYVQGGRVCTAYRKLKWKAAIVIWNQRSAMGETRYSTWLDTFITTHLCSGMGKKQDILGMTHFFWALSETGWVSVAIQYVWLPRDSENWRQLFHCCIVVSSLCGIALHHWLCSSSVWPVGNLVWVAAQIQTAFGILHYNLAGFH